MLYRALGVDTEMLAAREDSSVDAADRRSYHLALPRPEITRISQTALNSSDCAVAIFIVELFMACNKYREEIHDEWRKQRHNKMLEE